MCLAIVAFNGTLVKVNSDVALQCQGNAVPNDAANDILWFRNDIQLANSDKYTIVNVDGNSTLTVHTSGDYCYYFLFFIRLILPRIRSVNVVSED